MRPIKIASRASKLALAQSEEVCNLLRSHSADIEISILKVSTRGDRDKSDFLHKAESVGFFTSEVEKAVLNAKADIAVHSFKDLPTALTPGLIIAAVPKRASVADALVASADVSSIEDLPAGAAVGTSSIRRIAQLRHYRADLKPVPLRGNVETRVKKVISGQIDAAIIASAGLNRLGLSDEISALLPPEKFLPAAAQGALAVQIRAEDDELAELLAKIDDKPSRITAEAERCVLSALHGGCSIPLGVLARIEGDNITIEACLSALDGKKLIRRSHSGSTDKARETAEKLAQELLASGGQEILNQIRNM